jgi:hypothetical protein
MKELGTFQHQINKLTKSYEELIHSMRGAVSINVQKQLPRDQQDNKYKILQQKYIEFEESCDQLYYLLVSFHILLQSKLTRNQESVKKSVFTMYVQKKGRAQEELDKKKKQEDADIDKLSQQQSDVYIDLDAFQHSVRDFGNLMEMKQNLNKAFQLVQQQEQQQ